MRWLLLVSKRYQGTVDSKIFTFQNWYLSTFLPKQLPVSSWACCVNARQVKEMKSWALAKIELWCVQPCPTTHVSQNIIFDMDMSQNEGPTFLKPQKSHLIGETKGPKLFRKHTFAGFHFHFPWQETAINDKPINPSTPNKSWLPQTEQWSMHHSIMLTWHGGTIDAHTQTDDHNTKRLHSNTLKKTKALDRSDLHL